MLNTQRYIHDYIEWLKTELTIEPLEKNGWTKLLTPFLDRHNDSIAVYIKEVDSKLTITDDAYTMYDIETSGFNITGNRKEIIDKICRGFAVTLNKNEITIETNIDELPININRVIQTMLAIGDLSYLSKSNVRNLFFEDVKNWFDDNFIKYQPKYRVKGSSYEYDFDFYVPANNGVLPRIIETEKNPNKNNIEHIMFRYIDIEKSSDELSNVGKTILCHENGVKLNNDSVSMGQFYGIDILSWNNKPAINKLFMVNC